MLIIFFIAWVRLPKHSTIGDFVKAFSTRDPVLPPLFMTFLPIVNILIVIIFLFIVAGDYIEDCNIRIK